MSQVPIINPEAGRPMPLLNTVALRTLYCREIHRYLKGWQMSIAGPLLNVLLFMAIFGLALAGLRADTAGLPFLNYVAPGLVVMTAMQTAFEMTAWATIDAKIRGSLASLICAPMRPSELTGVLLAAGTTAGLSTGLMALLATQVFVDTVPPLPLMALPYALLGCLLTAAAGLITGLVAVKFDHVANVAGLVVAPVIFLSGVFFPVSAYGLGLDALAHFSPAFWVIDGVRHSLTGVAEATLLTSLLPLAGAALLMALAAHRIVATGYKVKQ
tara:strand:- start:1288 stop:2100 length:813 start_codon:yes stop_codon:yes gene_type:complete